MTITRKIILLESLDLPSLGKDFQIVCDLKMINIILGIQSCSSLFGCPFCEGTKVNEQGIPTNQRGKYVKGKLKTTKNIKEKYNDYLTKGGKDRKKLKNFKSVEFEPIKLKDNDQNEWVALTLTPF